MTSPISALDPHSIHATAATPPQPARARAGLWPWVPAALLASLLGTQLLVLSSVLDDPAFASEPDYYSKALDWDARQARARQSQALGWTARTAVDGTSPQGPRLTVALTDARGQPLGGARVHGAAFANARAQNIHELAFRELAAGLYGAELGPARSGVWELRLSAERGNDRYATTLRFELFPAGGMP